jgi:hypothetical protein
MARLAGRGGEKWWMSKRYSERDKQRPRSGCPESVESRTSYARRHGVPIGSLARWEAERQPGKDHARKVCFVEVTARAMATTERPKPAAAGVVVAKLVLPGGEQTSEWIVAEGQ